MAAGRQSPLYSSTLPRNFKRQGTLGALTDFARVEGMPGVLLANQLEAGVLEQYAQSRRHPDYESYIQTKVRHRWAASCVLWLYSSAAHAASGRLSVWCRYPAQHQALICLACLQISFNGGAQWQDLQPPASFRHSSCNRCSQGDRNCKLHLHGPSSWYAGPGALPAVGTAKPVCNHSLLQSVPACMQGSRVLPSGC